MRKARNIIEKIWDEHVVYAEAGHPTIFAIDLQLIHEVTSAQAFEELRVRKMMLAEPEHSIGTLDHSIPTGVDRHIFRDAMARKQVEQLRTNAKEFGLPFFDMDSGKQGIVHVIGPELGLTQPGMTIVCGDSHTSTHGAFGAMAFGIGTTEVAYVMASGCLLRNKPKTMKVDFKGKFKPGVFAKDAVLALIAKIGIDGGNGHIIEYTGETIRNMCMEERMTICNMSIECGARAGIIMPDRTTFEYLQGREYAPKSKDWKRAVEYWQSFASDSGAEYDRIIEIEVSTLDPMITWGTNPEQGIQISEKVPLIRSLPKTHQHVGRAALEYSGLREGQLLEGVPIRWAFLGSCTNARISDLRVGAKLIKGKKVAPGITFFVVPGSEQVKKMAEIEGLDKIFIDAGASWRNPGCSMCLGMNDDKVPAGERCVSSSNRNFVGRQGTGSITHLASPATVTLSAITGKITSPLKYF